MTRTTTHTWEFRPRFRKGAFGWKSQPAVARVKEAVAEIKKVARKDPVVAAEGAVLFLERVSPALENVDSSSGAIGSAVNGAIITLVEVIARAPAEDAVREKWLERLFEAHAADRIPYIESLSDFWGELCATPEVASRWADRLLDETRKALAPKKEWQGLYHGTSACLSALYAAGRYEEIVDLLQDETFWYYKRWAVRALAAQGKRAEALRLAESCRRPGVSDLSIDRIGEEILLSSGLVDEAYRRYGLQANRAGTYAAWFRAVRKKYPHKEPEQVLEDLVATTPGEEGKWFAAAKDAKLYGLAIVLALRSPCSPQTLTRAARDFEEKQPEFAVEAGLAALHWLVQGYGYEITNRDVLAAWEHTMKAAANVGSSDEVRERIRQMVEGETMPDRFVSRVLGPVLGLR